MNLEYHKTHRELPYTYHALKVAKQTQGEQYTTINIIFNSFSIVFHTNALDMPITAVIFVMNKCIANVLICNNFYARTINFKFC